MSLNLQYATERTDEQHTVTDTFSKVTNLSGYGVYQLTLVYTGVQTVSVLMALERNTTGNILRWGQTVSPASVLPDGNLSLGTPNVATNLIFATNSMAEILCKATPTLTDTRTFHFVKY